MRCQLCERDAVTVLCVYHQQAREKIEAAYPQWKSAYGGMEWKAFLSELKRNVQTGRWAKEVTEFLEKSE